MAAQSPTSSLYLLKENRVGLEPDVPSSVIEFQIPSSAITFSRASRPKRQILKTLPTYKSEDDFSSSAIATVSSIHFSRPDRYPRSFLWRLLEDNKVLEIRSVDLSKSEKEEDEAIHVLRFYFPVSIRQGGIALADVEDQSALNVFALTMSNELYTLVLKSSFFCYASASEEDIWSWCKTFKPASTNFSTPHQFVAVSSLELFIGLSDGRLLHLTRPEGSDGSSWYELACNDGQWVSSLRSLVRWQGSNTVRYGNAMLDQDTVQSMAYSPDKEHLWMVCLNHTIKVRNMKQSKTVYSTDLLGLNREPHEVSKLLLDPGNFNMLQMFVIQGAIEGDQYYIMTFSPHDLGQFKIWAVRDADAGGKGIRDLYPDYTFLPPDPDPNPDSKAIWKVADFRVMSVLEKEGNFLQIWILMKSNRRCKLYNLKLPLADLRRSLSYAWNNDWTVAASESINREIQPQITDTEAEGVFDTWLDFILQPGKYSHTAIETALSIYATTRKLNSSLDSKTALKERIHSAVSSHVALQRVRSGGIDFEAYRAKLNGEFGELWQDIRDLDARRWENVSYAYDSEAQMPWLVFGNGCSPIRRCNQTEIIAHNTEDVLRSARNEPSMQMDLQGMENEGDRVSPDELAVIVAAAANFRRTFSHELLQACNTTLSFELWQEPSHAASHRIKLFYDNCVFDSEIEDEAFECLASQLNSIGGFGGLKNMHFRAIASNVLSAMSAQPSSLRSTQFGLKALIRGVQDMVMLSRQILYDLLILVIVVHMEADMEADQEETSGEHFDAAELFVGILDILKQVQVVHWLATVVRPKPSKPSNVLDVERLGLVSQCRASTVLEQMFALDVRPRRYTDRSESVALTETIQDIMAYAMGGNYDVKLEDILVRIQCNLLAHDHIHLASDFLRYQPSTYLATYVKGRYYLLMGEFTEAAMDFQKASFGLCKCRAIFSRCAACSVLDETSLIRVRLPQLVRTITQTLRLPNAFFLQSKPHILAKAYRLTLLIFKIFFR